MKKENNPIDELFRKGLENRETKPSPQVWEKIEEATASEESGRGGFYFMRAAVVTLLIGLSTWVYMVNNEGVVTDLSTEKGVDGISTVITNTDIEPEKIVKEQTKEKPKSKAKQPKKDNTKTQGSKRRKIVPLAPSKQGPSTILVSNDLKVADEESLYGDEPLLQIEDLKVESKSKPKSIKLKYRVPVTEKSFYADNQKVEEEETERPKFKERVFAYANTQFGNLLNGKPLELPETPKKGKPQLEITFDKLFKN
jgi:hypothetical protein